MVSESPVMSVRTAGTCQYRPEPNPRFPRFSRYARSVSNLIPVVLSGGSGTRLWPLSTTDRPKQFVSLVGEASLFDLTLDRLGALDGVDRVIVVTGVSHVDLVAKAIGSSHTTVTTIVEPSGRNTAPAAIAAALVADREDTLLIVPADHVITDVSAFGSAVAKCVEIAALGRIVALGVVPTRPETGYGYIEVGDDQGPGFDIVSFVEKPSAEKAERLIADGNHFWNAGMFVTTAGHLLDETSKHAPGLIEGVLSAMTDSGSGTIELASEFEDVLSISIDHAVMEKTSTGTVVPLNAGWSDIGSYLSLHEISETDENGNSIEGQIVIRDVEGSLIRATSREVVVAGVKGLVVIETPERVLVIPLDKSQMVKDLAEKH